MATINKWGTIKRAFKYWSESFSSSGEILKRYWSVFFFDLKKRSDIKSMGHKGKINWWINTAIAAMTNYIPLSGYKVVFFL